MTMPVETKKAIEWALQQECDDGLTGFSFPVNEETPHQMVHYVRDWFNKNGIKYKSFSFADLSGFFANKE